MHDNAIRLSQRFIRIIALLRYYQFVMNKEYYSDLLKGQILDMYKNVNLCDDREVKSYSVYKRNVSRSDQMCRALNVMISSGRDVACEVGGCAESVRQYYKMYKCHESKVYDNMLSGFNKSWDRVIIDYLVVLGIILRLSRLALDDSVCNGPLCVVLRTNSVIVDLRNNIDLKALLNKHEISNNIDDDVLRECIKNMCAANIDVSMGDQAAFDFVVKMLFDNNAIRECMYENDLEWSFNMCACRGLMYNYVPGLIRCISDETYHFANDYNKMYTSLVSILCDNIDAIDGSIMNVVTNWSFGRIALIDRIVISLAIVEYRYLLMTPYNVVINEYIEIGKLFGNDKAGKFINGVLDSLLRGGTVCRT